MIIIGINEGINSSIVVSKDEEIIFAIQEERLNKKKEYAGFPILAIKYALNYLSLTPRDIDLICLSNLKSPYHSRSQILESLNLRRKINFKGLTYFKIRERINGLFKKKFRYKKIEIVLKELGLDSIPIKRNDHHLLHAASAYYGVRKNHHEPHLVLTLDGGGDGSCSHVYVVKDNSFNLVASSSEENSLGNIYLNITHFLGMKPHEHEYKVMGLAAYSNKEYCKDVQDKLETYLDLDPQDPLKFKKKIIEPLSFIGKRLIDDFQETRFDNLCGGLQFFTEDLILRWVKECIKKTGIKNIVVAGGVFMNIKVNKKISELKEVNYFNVMPSCGDETLPFGSVWYEYAKLNKNKSKDIELKTFFLGPDIKFDEIKFKNNNQNNFKLTKLKNKYEKIAELINKGEVVANCSGKMEFGARALGNRSLLADASNEDTIPIINKIIKKRDFWMPFAPAILKDNIDKFVKIPPSLSNHKYSFMMHSYETTNNRKEIKAGVHAYDHSTRAQIISEGTNEGFFKILNSLNKMFNKSYCLNTSFNLHGLPIVMDFNDAMYVINNSGLKYLIIEDYLIEKI